MKKVLSLLLVMLSNGVLANINCSGVPERVYAGAHGGNGAGGKYWVVFSNWEAYPLGLVTEELARSRYSMAMTALVSGKSIEMSFYSHVSCLDARTAQIEPTAMSLIK